MLPTLCIAFFCRNMNLLKLHIHAVPHAWLPYVTHRLINEWYKATGVSLFSIIYNNIWWFRNSFFPQGFCKKSYLRPFHPKSEKHVKAWARVIEISYRYKICETWDLKARGRFHIKTPSYPLRILIKKIRPSHDRLISNGNHHTGKTSLYCDLVILCLLLT